MKKLLFFLLSIFMLANLTGFAQTTYTCGFEPGQDLSDWTLVNGSSTNQWCVGTANQYGGDYGLYISNDNGTSNAYSNYSTTAVYAYREINVVGGTTLSLSFNWICNGEAAYDYLRVALAPVSAQFVAGTLYSGVSSSALPSGWIALDGGSNLSQQENWSSLNKEVTVPNSGLYNLVFIWRNDNSVGENPPAAVDDIVLTYTEPSCIAPGNLSVVGTTANSANISWTPVGSATSWQYVCVAAGDTPDWSTASTVTTPSASLSDLSAYTNYDVYVRSYCSADDQSDPVKISFQTAVDCGTAEYRQVNMGSGTNTSYYIPGYMSSSYPKADSWTIYPASEIIMYDVYEGLVKGVAYQTTKTASVESVKIYMANTEKTSFASVSDTISRNNMTLVYSGPIDFTANEWTEIAFNNAFSYDGHSNIALLFCRESAVTTSVYFKYTSVPSSSAYAYEYSTGSRYAYTTTYRPNTRFTMCVNVPSCADVLSVNTYNVERYSMDISWMPRATANPTNYQLVISETELDEAGLATATPIDVNGLSYSATNLTRNTTYYIYVRSNCGTDGYSNWVGTSEKTKGLEECLAIGNGNTTNSYLPIYGNYMDYLMRTQMIYFDSQLSELRGRSIRKMTFYAQNDFSYTANTQVSCAITSQSSLTSSFASETMTPVWTGHVSISNGELEIVFDTPFEYPADGGNLLVQFSNLVSGNYSSIPFKGDAVTGAGRYVTNQAGAGTVQDFQPQVTFCYSVLPCPTVTGLTAAPDEEDITKATVTWEASTGDFANTYDLYYTTTPTTDFTGVTPQYQNLDALTQELTGLAENTTYYVYVRCHCDADGQDDGMSEWAEAQFLTLSSCRVPLDVTATTTGKTSGTVSWTPGDETSTNFQYVLSTTELENPAAATATSVTGNSVSLTGLQPGTTYYFYVATDCGAGNVSPYAPAAAFTTAPACPPVRNIQTSDLAFNAVTVSWNRDQYGEETDWRVGVVGRDDLVWNVNDSSALVFGLAPETTYEIYVLAVCTTLSDSTKISVTTFANPGACVTVGDGTATNQYLPVYGYYCDGIQHTQSIYPADMLADLQGKTITSLKYFVSEGSSANWQDATFYVKMKMTEESSLSSNFVSDAGTQVYSGTLHASVDEGMEITLNEPFVYTGGNLLIDFNLPVKAGYSSCTFYGINTSPYAYSRLQSTNSTYPNSPFPFLPKVQLCCVPESCPRVTRLAVSNITTNEAHASWYPGGSETNWNLVCSTSELTEQQLNSATSVQRSTPYYDLANLTPNTTYYVYVQANCGNADMSAWHSTSFTTVATCLPPTDLAVSNVTSNSATLSWTDVNATPAPEYTVVYHKTNDATDPQHEVSALTNSVTISNLEANTAYTFKVKGLCSEEDESNWSDEYVFSTLSNEADIISMSVSFPYYIQIGDAVIDNVNHTVNFTVERGSELSGVYFDFVVSDDATATYNGSPKYGSLDYVNCNEPFTLTVTAQDQNISNVWTITLTPEACKAPVEVTTSNIERRSMDIAWTADPAADNTTGYQLVISETELDAVGLASATPIDVNGLTYSATNLTRNTTYYIYVRSNCGTDGYSNWIHTSAKTKGVEECLAIGNGNTTNAYLPIYGYYMDNRMRTQMIYFDSQLSAMRGRSIQKMTFYNDVDHTFTASTQVSCAITSQSSLTSSFASETMTPVWTGNVSVSNGELVIVFDTPFEYPTEGGNLLIQFSNQLGGDFVSSYNFKADAVEGASRYATNQTSAGTVQNFQPQVTFCYTGLPCPTVTELTAAPDEEDITKATVTWEASTGDYANTYDLYYTTTPTTDFTGVTPQHTNINGQIQELTGLAQNTTYYVYVRCHCDAEGQDDGVSEWAETEFLTLSSCRVPLDVTATTTGKTSGTASWTPGDETSTNFQYVLSTTELENPAAATAIPVTGNSVNLTGLQPGTTYYFYVATDCGAGNVSPYAPAAAFTTAPACPPVRNIQTSDLAFNAVTLSWNRGQYGEETAWRVGVVGQDNLVWDVTDSTAMVYGLSPETTYEIYVLANCSTLSDTESVTVTTPTDMSACVTVADGTATNNNVPVYGLYCDETQHTQSIYPATLLTDLQGKTITSLKYFVSSGSSANWQTATFNIKMKMTDENNLSSGFVSDAGTQVYSGTLRASVTDGMEITLDEPFVYTGGNLLIDFELPSATGYSSCSFYGINTSFIVYSREHHSSINTYDFLPKVQFCCVPESCPRVSRLAVSNITKNEAHVSWYPGGSETNWKVVCRTAPVSDPGNVDAETLNTPSMDLANLTPNTTYYVYVQANCGNADMSAWQSTSFTTVATCLAPTSLAADNVTSNSAMLSWTDANITPAPEYMVVYYKTDDPDSQHELTATINSVAISNLDANTTYTFKVKGLCSDEDESNWSDEASFTTLCDVFVVTASNPFVEDFEDGMVPPACWSAADNESHKWTAANHFPYVGFSTNAFSGYDGPIYLITQAITLPTEAETQLSFWSFNNYASDYGRNSVLISTTGNAVEDFTQELWAPESVSESVVNDTVSLASYAGQTVYIAFKYEGEYAHGWYLDDVKVEVVAKPCNAPTTLVAENVTSNSATLSWTDANATAAPQYVVAYGPSDDFDLADVTTYMQTTVTTNTFNVTNLTPNTEYTFQVKALCAEDNESEWSDAATFTAPCGAFVVTETNPFVEDFEDGVVPPACWSAVDNGTRRWSIYNTVAHDGSSASAYSGYFGDIYLITQAITLPSEGETQLSFWSFNYATGDYGPAHAGRNVVLVSTTGTAPDDFTQELWFPESVESSWVRTVLSLSDYAGDTIYIAFKYEGNNAHGWALDDVRIETAPCDAPDSLAADHITKNSATLSWTIGGLTSAPNYAVAYGTSEDFDMDDPTTYTLNTVTTTSLTLENLTPNTEYTFQVKALCAEDNESDWSDGASFTTLCEAFVVTETTPFVEDFEDGVVPPACWSDINNGDHRWGLPYSLPEGSSFCAYSKYYGDVYLITQALVLPNQGETQLTFRSMNDYLSYEGGRNSVRISTTGNAVADFTQELWTPVIMNDVWENDTISLATYAGQTVYIAFKYEGEDAHGWYLDDVKVEVVVEPCNAPTTLVAENVTSNSATLSWTDANATAAPQYAVAYGPSEDFDLADATTYTLDTVATTSVTLANLTPNTEYTFQVKALCAEDNESDWSATADFQTEELSMYTITVNQPTVGGEIAASAENSIAGESILLTATPDNGYSFVSWNVTGTNGSILVNENNAFTMPASDVTVTATFEPNVYTITYYTNGGTVNSGNVETYTYGVGATLPTDVTKTGYTFNGWYGNADLTGDAVAEVADSEMGNKEFWAKWSLNAYTVAVTASPAAGGAVTGAGTYNYNTSATVMATAANDYLFSNWTENGDVVSSDASYTFTVTDNRTLVANFTQMETVATPTFTPAAGTYVDGTDVTIECTTPGASIYYTTDGTEPTVNSTMYTAPIALDATTTVKAVAAKTNMLNSEVATATYRVVPTWNVTVADVDGGSATANPTADTTGAVIMLTAVPDNGYHFDRWSVVTTAGELISVIDDQFTMPTGNVTVTPTFAPDQYTITYNTNGGTINSGNVTTYTYGVGATLPTDVTKTGYTFDGWYGNANLTGDAVAEVADTEMGNKEFWAKWSVNAYTVAATASPAAGGAVTGTGLYEYNTSATVSATAADGYLFSNWTENGSVVSSDASYTFTVTDNRTLVANFTQMGVVASPTYTPAAGTYIDEVSVAIECATPGASIYYTTDGTEPTVNSTLYTAPIALDATTTIKAVAVKTDMTNSLTSSATYRVVPSWNVTVADVDGGSATANPTADTTGAVIMLTATPDNGYHFGSWTVISGNGAQVNVAGDQFTMPASDVTVTPTFVPDQYTITYYTNGGTVNSGNVESYTYGVGATLPTDVTKTGYTFNGWYDNANLTGDAVAEVADSEMGNKEFWAKWSLNAYTVAATASPAAGGAVTGAGTYNYNTSATVSATAADGYLFSNWTENENVVSSDASYTFTVTDNRTLVANFTQMETVATPTFTPAAGTYVDGTDVTIECTTPGASIYYTTDGTEPTVNSTMYTAPIALDATTTVKAVAAKTNMLNSEVATATYRVVPTWNVTVADVDGGSATANPTADTTGAVIMLTATPDNGYHFGSWTVISGNGAQVNVAGDQFVMPASDVTVSATFEPNVYTITYNTNGGTINSGNVTTYTYGVGATLPTDVTKTGYTFNGWYGNANLTGDAVAEVADTEMGNKEFWAKWSVNAYTVTATASPAAGGAVTGAGTYNYNTSATVSATAADGYLFSNWTENENVVSTDASYTFTVTDNRTLVANFTQMETVATPTITPAAGTYVDGTDVTIECTTPGASIYYTTDGTEPTVNSTLYTAPIALDATTTIKAMAAKTNMLNSEVATATYRVVPTWNVTVAVVDGGSATANPTADTTGAVITLTATPDNGYHFGSWTVISGNGAQVNVAGDQFVMPASDVTVTPTFVPNQYTITYNTNGGTINSGNVETYTYGVGATLPTNVTKTGYTFNGWYGNANLTGNAAAEVSDSETGNKEFWAKWSVNDYALTINYLYPNGTVAAPAYTADVEYNTSYEVTSPAVTGCTPDIPVVEGTMPAQAKTVTVTYDTNAYQLTIDYVYPDNSIAAASYIAEVKYGTTYSVQSPAITGYTPDVAVVTGTMPAQATAVTVTYDTNTYVLTINYGAPVSDTYTADVKYGVEYNVTSPAVTGYTPDQTVVSGTMGADNVTVDVNYTVNKYKLTVNYNFVDGAPAATTYTDSVDYNETYSVQSPAITGYTPNTAVVAGTMPAEDKSVDVVYNVNSYDLTVNYKYADGTTAAPAHTESVNYNVSYSVPTPFIDTYMPDVDTVKGTMDTAAVTVDVTFKQVVMNPVSDVVVCNNNATDDIAFTSTMTDADMSFDWTNDNPSVGLVGAGSGNIESFVAVNRNSAPAMATVEVTPICTQNGVDYAGVPQTFTITVNPTNATEFTATACDSYVWAGTTYDVEGTHDYTQTFTNVYGCDSVVTMHLTIYKTPTAIDTRVQVNTMCSGTPNGSIEVTVPSGDFEYSLDGSTYQTSSLFENLSGDYTVYVRPAGSICVASSDAAVETLNTYPTAVASVANAQVCLTGDIELSADGSSTGDNFSYAWSGPNSFTSAEMNPTFEATTGEQSGAYTLTVTDITTNCSSTSDVQVVVNTPSNPDYLFEIVCPYEAFGNIAPGASSATVNLVTPSYNHFLSDMPATTVEFTNDAPAEYYFDDTYRITWTATDNCGNTAECVQLVTIYTGECPTAQDWEGNTYPAVMIDGNCWMAMNLRSKNYADGRAIDNVMSYSCVEYPDAEANVATFGHLYDWYAAMDTATHMTPNDNGHVQGICPDGWYLPTADQFTDLTGFDALNTMNNYRVNGVWLDGGGNNSTGFSMLPAGFYNGSTARYENLYGTAYFWSYNSSAPSAPKTFWADCHCYMFQIIDNNISSGCSVRCVKE